MTSIKVRRLEYEKRHDFQGIHSNPKISKSFGRFGPSAIIIFSYVSFSELFACSNHIGITLNRVAILIIRPRARYRPPLESCLSGFLQRQRPFQPIMSSVSQCCFLAEVGDVYALLDYFNIFVAYAHPSRSS